MAQHYLVTRSRLGGDDKAFFDAFHDALDELAKDGIALDAAGRQESATQVRVIYSDAENRIKVTLWDDYIAETRYLEINSGDAALADTVKAALERHVDTETLAGLMAQARGEMATNPRILARLAYASPVQFDAEFFAFMRTAIDHEQPEVRKYAAYAAGVIGWREFVPVLEARMATEPPGEAKSYMETALKLCRGGR